MKEKYIQTYMKMAEIIAECSNTIGSKVGCVMVINDIIIPGFNQMPNNSDKCVFKSYMDKDASGWLDIDIIELQWPYEDETGRYKLITKSEVLPAELNALAKVATTSLNAKGAVLFCTHAPCLNSAILLYQCRIKQIYFKEICKDETGIELLRSNGIPVTKLK